MEIIYRDKNYNVDGYGDLGEIVHDNFVIIENGDKNNYYPRGSGYHKTISKNKKVSLSFSKIAYSIAIDENGITLVFSFYNNGNMEFSYLGGGFAFSGSFVDYICHRIVRKSFLFNVWHSSKIVLYHYLDKDSLEYHKITTF